MWWRGKEPGADVVRRARRPGRSRRAVLSPEARDGGKVSHPAGVRTTVLVVDDSADTRESIRRMVGLHPDLEVVGEAGSAEEGLKLCHALRPRVVLMDINLPGRDGIWAAGEIVRRQGCPVVMLSVEGEHEYVRRAMQAGASDYLVKPFGCPELVEAIRQAAKGAATRTAAAETGTRPGREGRPGTVVTFFGTKGGVGKSTLAANVAVGLSLRGLPTVLIDLDLEFGVISTLLGLRPPSHLADLCRAEGGPGPDLLRKVLVRGPGGLQLLAAPSLPHEAAEVEGEGRRDPDRNYVADVLDILKGMFAYVVIDTARGFRESNLTVLDRSSLVLVVTVPELPALENTAKGLHILLRQLAFPAAKVKLLLNRADSAPGLTSNDIATGLGMDVSFEVPSDGQAVAAAANYGQPFILNRRESPLTSGVWSIVEALASVDGGDEACLPSMNG